MASTELLRLLAGYMARAKNLYDGEALKEAFSEARAKAEELGDEAAIAYFSGLLSRRDDIANNRPALEAIGQLEAAAAAAKGSDDPAHVSIFCLAQNMKGCAVKMNVARHGSEALLSQLSKVTGEELRSAEDAAAYAEAAVLEGLNHLLSASHDSLAALGRDIAKVNTRADTLPEALAFALTATADFLGAAGLRDAARGVFSVIEERIDPGYYGARMQHGRLSWRCFIESPSREVADELVGVYQGLLELVWSKRTDKAAQDPMAFAERASEDRGAVESFVEAQKTAYPPSEPFELALVQLCMARNARSALLRTVGIGRRALCADGARISADSPAYGPGSARSFV